MRLFLLGCCILFVRLGAAQSSLTVSIRSGENKEPLVGATASVLGSANACIADANGMLTLKNIPDGRQVIQFSFLGFESKKDTFDFPLASGTVTTILLSPVQKDLEMVIVTATRGSRSMENTPTRVEVISAAELDEEAHMKPGEIRKLLTEGTGITTQQTSASSGVANIRIQGLDGRYTQLLRDGMPLYEGYSGGLSIMQIAPLDLSQIEFIKGSASTLYGGGAIAGLIDLVSKTPKEKRELTFLVNGTSAKGLDVSSFYSQKHGKWGTTLLSSYDFNAPYDPAGIGLTAIPKINRFTFNPKLFVDFSQKTSGWVGVNTTFEDRFGGDLQVIDGKTSDSHRYFERNKVSRTSTQLSLTHRVDSVSAFNFKNSINVFSRRFSLPLSSFVGNQTSSFSELNYSRTTNRSVWVAGLNLWTEQFHSSGSSSLQYQYATLGLFTQNTLQATEKIFIETGLRLDENSPAPKESMKGLFVLPRVNLMFKFNPHITSRIGGGMGYKMPTPFIQDAESLGYSAIQPMVMAQMKAEQSYAVNGDLTFTTALDEWMLSINQLFFLTRLDRPLLLESNQVVNADGYLLSQGAETNIKLTLDELNLFVGYTYTDSHRRFDGKESWQPLTARHRVLIDLTYEDENNWRTGAECNYVSPQLLSDGTMGRGYFVFGLLFEKIWKHINLFVNAENLTDSRQTRWGAIYSGNLTDPLFRDIYAPLEGMVINGGMKIKL